MDWRPPCKLATGLVACLTCLPVTVHAMCCPIPCYECLITSAGQANLVVMERENGVVRLIPNIIIQGMAADFALVVPTPALPEFRPVSSVIWEQARRLTAPLSVWRRDSGAFGCSRDTVVFDAATTETASPEELEVVVHDRQSVGAFDVTVVSSTDPHALLDWLIANDYSLSANDADKFAPYVARGWFFTAMKLDRSDPANQMPPDGWDVQVDPVEIRYSATEFEAALPIASINRATWMPMLFYVVDDHRATLEGATTLYANRLSSNEYRGVTRAYPELAAFMRAGRFVTALARTFTDSDTMDTSAFIERAPTDSEFRRGVNLGALPLELWFVVALVVAFAGRVVLRVASAGRGIDGRRVGRRRHWSRAAILRV